MGVVHKFSGKSQENYDWEGQRYFEYGAQPDVSDGTTVRWLIGAAEQAQDFAMRYFEIMPGGHSAPEDQHHQFINASQEEPFGFICVVPAHRTKKSGKQVYAESDIFPEHLPKAE